MTASHQTPPSAIHRSFDRRTRDALAAECRQERHIGRREG